MKLKITLSILTIVLITNMAYSQTGRTCGTMDLYQQMMQNPEFVKNRQKIEEHTAKVISQNPDYRASSVPIVIPVVVHVVYQTAAQNIPDTRVQSQIDQLNADYAATNSDIGNVPSVFQSLVGNTNIQFCLAQRDPNGNPHSGIIHKQTTVASFGLNDAIKFDAQGGSNAWPRDQYLNLWIGNLSGGLLGYAQFPGGTANTDGVVSLYSSIGSISNPFPGGAPYNIGRTTTHEVGHWLNLFHIWGDANCGNDQVADTPTADGSHFGCPAHPHHTNACGAGSSPNGELTMNYMDYTDDPCMYMFTLGQGARMNAALSGPRLPLQSSLGCVPVNLQQNDAGISAIIQPSGAICASSIAPQVTLRNFGINTLTSVTINYQVDGGTVNTYSWTGSLSTNSTANVTLSNITFGAGVHTFNAYTTNPNGTTDQNASNDASNSNFSNVAIGQALPIQQDFQAITFPPAGYTVNNPDGSYTWERTMAAGQASNASMFLNYYDYNSAGAIDEFDMPSVNLATQNNPELKFWVAYALYSATGFSDTLEVLVSTNCGSTWTSVYKKFGTPLTTAPNSQIAFVPTASQWRQETVSLAPYATASSAIVRFRGICDYENNLYVDNINIQGLVGIYENAEVAGINIYPNPSSGLINMIIPESMNGVVYVNVLNATGSAVISYRINTAESRKVTFDLSENAKGIYLFDINHNGNHYSKRLSIER